MKKQIIQIFNLGLLSISALAFAVACNSGGGGSSGSSSANNGYASTPQPCNYQYGSPYGSAPSNCSTYTNYYSTSANSYSWQYGAWLWPTQYMASQGNCGCPSGYFPVQSSYYGVACAPSAYQSAYGSGYYGGGLVYYSVGNWGAYWNYSQNGGWLNRPQAVYQPAVSTNNSCGSSTAQGCDVRVNNCPTGSRCQAVAGGSTIGLCVR